MNVTVESLAPCKKLLRVEVDAAAVDATYKTVTSEFQRRVNLPGFRPGKAPLDRVSKLFASDIQKEVQRKVITTSLSDAIKQEKLNLAGTPEVEEVPVTLGNPVQFTATIEIAPEFELPEYKGLAVRIPRMVVTPADMERALMSLRERQATYLDVERPAQAGDFVVVNYQASVDGKPLQEIAPNANRLAEYKSFWLRLEPDSFLPGFAEQLTGAKATEKRTVVIDFPAGFPEATLGGKRGEYAVEVLQVKELQLPELNDEFAKAFGAETVDKLREGVMTDLQNQIKQRQNSAIRSQITKALLDRARIEDLPESIVLGETRSLVYDIVKNNTERGIAKEILDEKKDEIYNSANTSAKERVKWLYLARKIVEKEKIQVSWEEVHRQVMLLAQQNQIKPEKLLKQLQEKDALGEIAHNIAMAKVVDLLQLHAQIEEESVAGA